MTIYLRARCHNCEGAAIEVAERCRWHDAASDMMTALQGIVASLEDDHQACPWCEDQSWYGEGHAGGCWLGEAKAAIAKATGAS